DSDATATKDGNVNTSKPASTEVTASLILSTQDDLIDALEDACQNGDLLEIWEINLQKPTTTVGTKPMKYKGKYMQGTLT
ncbi:phage major tail protein, TP901-1 family, partial [Streptococcus thermophilus]|nr:phage major tail protein, TP901-1 family [Streptococcus thermophilus]